MPDKHNIAWRRSIPLCRCRNCFDLICYEIVVQFLIDQSYNIHSINAGILLLLSWRSSPLPDIINKFNNIILPMNNILN
jgi:hypothetical protein